MFPLIERDGLARQSGVASGGERIARRDACGSYVGGNGHGDRIATVASDRGIRRVDEARHNRILAQDIQTASDQFVNNWGECVSHDGSSPLREKG